MGASLELMLIEANSGKIVWGGAGEWKRSRTELGLGGPNILPWKRGRIG